jgi:hypothetical protein
MYMSIQLPVSQSHAHLELPMYTMCTCQSHAHLAMQVFVFRPSILFALNSPLCMQLTPCVYRPHSSDGSANAKPNSLTYACKYLHTRSSEPHIYLNYCVLNKLDFRPEMVLDMPSFHHVCYSRACCCECPPTSNSTDIPQNMHGGNRPVSQS